MRTRLEMERHRLLAWAQGAQLLNYRDGDDLPSNLRTSRVLLVAVLAEMRNEFKAFSHINGKYVELRPKENEKEAAEEVDLLKGFSSVSMIYEKAKEARKRPKGTNHLRGFAADAGAIIQNPKRLIWVGLDSKKFSILISRLRELNDFLGTLMDEYQIGQLVAKTRTIYMEMLQVRGTVEQLQYLMEAAVRREIGRSTEEDTKSTSKMAALSGRNEEMLAKLARVKLLDVTLDSTNEMQFTLEDDSKLPAAEVNISDAYLDGVRTAATYRFLDGSTRNVWIEWKAYETITESNTPGMEALVPHPATLRRFRELIQLLRAQEVPDFCIPSCLGYFDDHLRSGSTHHRFGVVFEVPRHIPSVMALKSLRSLLQPEPRPLQKASLSTRTHLAHKIANCVAYLHAVNWLHKGIRSDNVIFFMQGSEHDMDHFYLTGFEHSRPDRTGMTTNTGHRDPAWELYRHPGVQGTGKHLEYRKTYDLYSLGIVLLEIAFWQPVEVFLGIGNVAEAKPSELESVRNTLLFNRPEILDRLRADVGVKYHGVVRRCLEGPAAFGLADPAEDKKETKAEFGARLQEVYMTDVLGVLESISV